MGERKGLAEPHTEEKEETLVCKLGEALDGNGHWVIMIIKGLFRRYERWNPVHPTCGAFWGMGVGVGCGVGWGPGFGPEVIGYVGAGCGVGFSVGFTLMGVGIGLPADFVFEVPYNTIKATRSCAMGISKSDYFLSASNAARGGWNNIAPYISGLQREARGKYSTFMRSISPMHSPWPASISKIFKTSGSRIIGPPKDTKD